MGTSRIAAAYIALISLTAVLAGCSANVAQDPAGEPTSAAASPAAASSTVAQWASLVAQQKAEWDEWSDSWDENKCSALTAVSASGLICQVQLTTASFMAATTTIEYELAVTPGKNGFIATEPPAEVSSLFAQTRAAAQRVRDDAEAWDAEGCSSSMEGNCVSLTVSYDRAIQELKSAFVGWTPYM